MIRTKIDIISVEKSQESLYKLTYLEFRGVRTYVPDTCYVDESILSYIAHNPMDFFSAGNTPFNLLLNKARGGELMEHEKLCIIKLIAMSYLVTDKREGGINFESYIGKKYISEKLFVSLLTSHPGFTVANAYRPRIINYSYSYGKPTISMEYLLAEGDTLSQLPVLLDQAAVDTILQHVLTLDINSHVYIEDLIGYVGALQESKKNREFIAHAVIIMMAEYVMYGSRLGVLDSVMFEEEKYHITTQTALDFIAQLDKIIQIMAKTMPKA